MYFIFKGIEVARQALERRGLAMDFTKMLCAGVQLYAFGVVNLVAIVLIGQALIWTKIIVECLVKFIVKNLCWTFNDSNGQLAAYKNYRKIEMFETRKR